MRRTVELHGGALQLPPSCRQAGEAAAQVFGKEYSYGFDASPGAVRGALDDVARRLRGRKLRIPIAAAACPRSDGATRPLARGPRFRAPEFLVASAHVRDAVPDDFYELSGLYNKEWHAPLRASTTEAYWEKQKIFFPGGDAFVHREAGSHRGQVLADGALFGDTCHDPDAFDATNLVADTLAILHFEMSPFADWRDEMTTRAADQRREAQTETEDFCGGENGHWLANADAVRDGEAAARNYYALLCSRVGGPDAVEVAFSGLRDRLVALDAADTGGGLRVRYF